MAVVTTASSSGKAFSVTSGLGRLSSPRGQAGLPQKPRTCCRAASISAGVSAPRKAGISLLKARAGPPSRMTASQSESGSRVANEQSVKSGTGRSNPSVVCGTPVPFAPWQLRQAAR